MLTAWLRCSVPCLWLACGPAYAQPADEALAVWRDGGAIVLMRHALAPGAADPAGFDLRACETQRNLSEAGREQARAIGARLLHALGEDRAVDILSSGWCRCLETGRLLGLGDVRRLPPLDSFFQAREREPESTRALVAWLDARQDRDAPPAVLVTHQVNITALTGAFASSGEMLVIAPDADAPNGYGVLGTIATPVAR